MSASVTEAPLATQSQVERRVGQGVGALALGTILGISAQFVVVPVALRVWGALKYGEWVVLTGIVTMLRVTDLGIQTYVVNRLAGAYARGERAAFHRELHSALLIQAATAGGALIALGALFSAVPVGASLGLVTIGGAGASVILYLLALELLLGVPMGTIAGVYRATGHLPRAAYIGAAQQAGFLVALIGLIALDANFVTVAAARVAIALVASAVVLWDVRRMLPWLRFGGRDGDWRLGAAMVLPGASFLLVLLADFVTLQAPLIVLQRVSGGEAVSAFSTHRTLVHLAPAASALLTNAAWPELTAAHARGDREGFGRLYALVAKTNVAIVTAILVLLLPLILMAYPLWTGGTLAVAPVTLGLLMLRTVVWSSWNGPLTLLLAINRQHAAAFAVGASALAGAAGALVLVPHIGMAGAAAGLLIGDLAVAAWLLPRWAAREAGTRPWAVVRDTLKMLGVLAAVALAAGAAWWAFRPSAVGQSALVVVASAAGASLLWRSFDADERRRLRSAASSAIPFRISLRSPP